MIIRTDMRASSENRKKKAPYVTITITKMKANVINEEEAIDFGAKWIHEDGTNTNTHKLKRYTSSKYIEQNVKLTVQN